MDKQAFKKVSKNFSADKKFCTAQITNFQLAIVTCMIYLLET